jgi:hypothetical protein
VHALELDSNVLGDIITKVEGGRATLDRVTESATHHSDAATVTQAAPQALAAALARPGPAREGPTGVPTDGTAVPASNTDGPDLLPSPRALSSRRRAESAM